MTIEFSQKEKWFAVPSAMLTRISLVFDFLPTTLTPKKGIFANLAQAENPSDNSAIPTDAHTYPHASVSMKPL